MHKADVTEEQLQRMIEVHTTFSTWEMGGPAFLANAKATADALRELQERRTEDTTTRGLERTFAYDQAFGTIDGEAPWVTRDGETDSDWMDLSTCRYEDGEMFEHVAEALRYLDSRGLVQRDPEHPDWIAIRDEGEADDILGLPSAPAPTPST